MMPDAVAMATTSLPGPKQAGLRPSRTIAAPAIPATDDVFGSSVTDMASRGLGPILDRVPPDQPVDKRTLAACLRHVAATGYFGMRVAPAAGGSELPLTAGGLVTEAIPTFLAVSAIAQEATTFRLAASAPGEMHERYLGGLIAGELIGGTCISEPDVGSDSNSVRTTLRRDGAGLRLSGVKLWSTNATVADVLVVLARADDASLVRVILDADQEGIEIRDVPTTGLRRGHLAEVVLDVDVAPERVLRGEVASRLVLNSAWALNRCSMALAASALLGRALATATDYCTTRTQFGSAIGSFQLIQGILADAQVARDAGRLLGYRALALLETGQAARAESSAAKLFATEAAVAQISKLQQVAGSYGITPEFPYAQWLADASMLIFPDGTPQMHRLIMGREITGRSAFRGAS